MNTTETNRRFLKALFSTIASEGWADGFMTALHDDLVFNAMDTSPAGTTLRPPTMPARVNGGGPL